MSQVKIAVMFYSKSGINAQLARWATAAAEAAGAEVRLLRFEETAPAEVVASDPKWKATADDIADIKIATGDDIVWADGVIFSSPGRYGVVSAQITNFIDQQGPLWAKGLLADKTATAMTSTQNPQGGQEMTTLSLYISLMHWGMILVPPGYTDEAVIAAGGNPYGTSATQGPDMNMLHPDKVKPAVEHQARRLVEVTRKLIADRD